MPCACGGWGSSSGGQTRSDVAAQKIPRRDETRHVGSPRPLWPAGDGDNTTPRAPRQRNAGKKIRAAVRRRRCSSVRCDDGCPIITPPLLLLHPRDAKRSAQTNQPAGLGILRLCEHPPRPVSLSLSPTSTGRGLPCLLCLVQLPSCDRDRDRRSLSKSLSPIDQGGYLLLLPPPPLVPLPPPAAKACDHPQPQPQPHAAPAPTATSRIRPRRPFPARSTCGNSVVVGGAAADTGRGAVRSMEIWRWS